MPRITIEIPEQSMVDFEITVRITDLNYGRHLGNDRLLSLLHEARADFFSSRGYKEWDVDGAVTVIADMAIVYKAEAFYGDRLRIRSTVTEFSRCGFDIVHQVLHKNTGNEIARAKTGIVLVDMATRSAVHVSDSVKMNLSATGSDTMPPRQ